MTACSRSLNSDWHVPVPYSCTGTGRESDMELELGQIEVNDAHLADALAGLSDDEFQ